MICEYLLVLIEPSVSSLSSSSGMTRVRAKGRLDSGIMLEGSPVVNGFRSIGCEVVGGVEGKGDSSVSGVGEDVEEDRDDGGGDASRFSVTVAVVVDPTAAGAGSNQRWCP